LIGNDFLIGKSDFSAAANDFGATRPMGLVCLKAPYEVSGKF
jgi:hypothetical protein